MSGPEGCGEGRVKSDPTDKVCPVPPTLSARKRPHHCPWLKIFSSVSYLLFSSLYLAAVRRRHRILDFKPKTYQKFPVP